MTETTLERPTALPSLADTFLADAPEDVRAALLDGARILRIEAGRAIFGNGDEPSAGFILEGTARWYLRAADGRQLTVRYARLGAFLARRSYLLGGHAPTAIQAMSECTVLEIDARALLRLMETDAGVASAVAAELSRRLEDVHATVADSTFGSMRQRVARHLLAISDGHSDGHSDGRRRVAVVTQQQLADGVGTSREVAARVLGALRREGLIRTAPGEIEIIDRPGLGGLLGEWQVAPRRLGADLLFEAEALLEASPNAILAVDSDGSIAYANSSAESSFGWPRDEIIGQPIEVLIPDRLQATHRDHRARFLASPKARPMGRGLDLWARRRDGSEFPVAVSLTVLETRDGALVVATAVDMSAAKAMLSRFRDGPDVGHEVADSTLDGEP